MPRRLLIFSQSGYLTHIVAINLHTWWQTVQIQISWLLQKLTDLDLHCLQNRVYLGSAGQGLTSARSPWYYTFDLDVKLQPNKIMLKHPDMSVHWSFMSTLYCQWFGLLVRLYLCMTGRNIYRSLTLVLLNHDIPCLCKQCRSRSVGFFRSQLIWICTVCH